MNFLDFTNYYFTAENRAAITVNHDGVKCFNFQIDDKVEICKRLDKLIKEKNAKIRDVARYLSETEDPTARGYKRTNMIQKHMCRLNTWQHSFKHGALEINNVIQNSPPPRKTDMDKGVVTMNLTESVHAVCRSALKNNLSQQEFFGIIEKAYKIEYEEMSTEIKKKAFVEFMKENGLTKEIIVKMFDKI